MKRFLLSAALFLCSTGLFAQSINESQVNGSFQIDGQYYKVDEAIGITEESIDGKKFGLNGFGKINYSLGNFTAGLRYEAYLPQMSGFDTRLQGCGIANYYASYDNGTISVTIGDIYDQFGNGFIFRTYEEWALGFDNSLRGMRVIYRPAAGVTLKGVYGKQRFFWNSYGATEKRGIVRGIDGEWDLNQSFNAMNDTKFRASLGGSFVSKYQKNTNTTYNIPENVGAFDGRINLGYGRFAFTTEYAYKINDPSAFNNYTYNEGQAILSSLSYSQKGFGVILQVKRVDNMSFKSDYQGVKNDLDINFIPPINYTHTHSLPAIYSYATQPLGEMAMQLQVNYTIPKNTIIGGKYGTKLTLDFSQVNDIKRNYIIAEGQGQPTHIAGHNGTLGYTSPFFAVGDRKFFHDFNIELERRLNKKWKLIAQYINLYYDMETIENHPGAEVVKANIGFVDVSYRITSKQSIRFELQHLWDNINKNNTTEASTVGHEDVYKKRGNWAAALVEYSIAPKWFVSVADKYNYGNPIADNRDHYYTASVGYIKESTRITLTGGRQSEGMVCVGGVCRVVPASSGVSISITTSF
ncbi:MAG: hypothetical protein J6R17_07385 [Bacteroidales bacterium]|nr:hypothetical protein [Bacteroidales bacterium]MBO5849011.1 hypothetical protein [Bacteroidales bacterium]